MPPQTLAVRDGTFTGAAIQILRMSTDDFYSLREIDGVTVIRLNVENLLSVSEVNQVGSMINGIVEGGVKKLVLDLKHVKYAGSAALGMMLSLRENLQTLGGKLALSHAEHLDKLLSVSRTKNLFQIAANPAEAVALLKD